MSHLDEGTLHALLDGELDATELMQIEAHLGTCAACGSRLRDARNFLSEADRLVATVQFSGAAAGAPPRTAAPPPRASAPPPRASAPATPPPPPPPPRREERSWEPENESPVLLIPDNPESAPFSRRWPLLLGVAATIAVAVGAGYTASHIGKSSSSGLASAPRPVMQPAESQAVVSPAESERALASTQRDSAEPDSPAVRAPAPVAVKPAPPAPKPARTLAAREVAPAKEAPAGSKDTAEEADQSEEAATRAAEQEAIRLQAANALNQLDRERRVSRAATATARLDQATLERNQKAATAGAVAAAPPPPPPTLEQRAQVYLRIGLDEASRQLGGPVHVIEGMNPTLMGLAPGRVAAGADTSRPVVRVVYQDSQGRMILLDQQRRSGQPAPPPSTGAWSLGDVTMGLHGDVPAETLRSLRSRVR